MAVSLTPIFSYLHLVILLGIKDWPKVLLLQVPYSQPRKRTINHVHYISTAYLSLHHVHYL